MQHEEIRRRSRWIMRAMEWDDSKARYPNLWHEGMPRHVLAFDRVASRLRLGDLVASYYPASQKHPDRSERYLGISRVVGLRGSERAGYAWIDLETAHPFTPPLRLNEAPRRVFLCCDPGWSEPEVALFRRVFDAAVAAGWQPTPEELEEEAPKPPEEARATPEETPPETESAEGEPPPQPDAPDGTTEPAAAPVDNGEPVPMFAGVDYGGDMRDPRGGTWLAIVALEGSGLRLTRLEATGRSGLQSYLRDPDRALMHVDAIGLDFPFALPQSFSELLLGGSFPDEGWWALVKRFERLSRPDFLVAVQEFREAHGEIKRHTDETAEVPSPLNRAERDLSTMTYHGIRMIGEDRSRFAIRPFESAQGKLLLEVHPDVVARRLDPDTNSKDQRARRRAIVSALERLERLPVKIQGPHLRTCSERAGALEAVLAARCAAAAVLSGEADRSPDDLAPDNAERIRREGWIYGLQDPA
jgi:hypothetical protein